MVVMNTYLNFSGNTEEAFDFYKSVFGGEFSSLVRFKDMPMDGMDVSDDDLNKIMHIGLPIGEKQILMGSDILESSVQKTIFGNNIYISIHPDSREHAEAVFNSLSEGAQIEMPMADQPWGDYFGSLIDRFAVPWMVMYHDD